MAFRTNLSLQPARGDNLAHAFRYDAACAAALAAAGQGEDAAKLDDREGARWRKQALDWLQADLALWAKRLQSADAKDRARVQKALAHWQEDRDLAGVREPAALKKLSAPEQAAWRKLWAEVAALAPKALDAK